MDVDTGVVGETEVVPVHPGVTYDTEVVGEAEICQQQKLCLWW